MRQSIYSGRNVCGAEPIMRLILVLYLYNVLKPKKFHPAAKKYVTNLALFT